MNVIRMIKLFGWEPKVKQEIDEKRSEELVWIKRRQYLDIINGCVKFVTNFLCGDTCLTLNTAI